MQHGRDQLHDLFPDLYDTRQSAELPAECMYELHKGSNCGWPYIYYDQFLHKKILAPEYGGDGKKTAGEDAQDPLSWGVVGSQYPSDALLPSPHVLLEIGADEVLLAAKGLVQGRLRDAGTLSDPVDADHMHAFRVEELVGGR